MKKSLKGSGSLKCTETQRRKKDLNNYWNHKESESKNREKRETNGVEGMDTKHCNLRVLWDPSFFTPFLSNIDEFCSLDNP